MLSAGHAPLCQIRMDPSSRYAPPQVHSDWWHVAAASRVLLKLALMTTVKEALSRAVGGCCEVKQGTGSLQQVAVGQSVGSSSKCEMEGEVVAGGEAVAQRYVVGRDPIPHVRVIGRHHGAELELFALV